MEYFIGTKIQISPCIAAKAKFALKITVKNPTNINTCSHEYWCKVIDTFSSQYNISENTASEAKKSKPLQNKK